MFEEYLYYAAITRAQEARVILGSDVFEGDPWNFNRKRRVEEGPRIVLGLRVNEGNNAPSDTDEKPLQMLDPEIKQEGSFQSNVPTTRDQPRGPPQHLISHQEWLEVSRATRNASWSAIFFLITTDVFGPLTIP